MNMEIRRSSRSIFWSVSYTHLDVYKRQEVSGFVEDYFAQLGDGNVKSIFLRQYVVMDLYVTAVSVLEKSGYKSRDLVERCGDAKEMVAYLTTVEQTREYIKKPVSYTHLPPSLADVFAGDGIACSRTAGLCAGAAGAFRNESARNQGRQPADRQTGVKRERRNHGNGGKDRKYPVPGKAYDRVFGDDPAHVRECRG